MNGKERRSINVAQRGISFSETLADSRHKCLLISLLKNLNMKMDIQPTSAVLFFVLFCFYSLAVSVVVCFMHKRVQYEMNRNVLKLKGDREKDIRKDWNALFLWSFAKQSAKYSS